MVRITDKKISENFQTFRCGWCEPVSLTKKTKTETEPENLKFLRQNYTRLYRVETMGPVN